MLRALLVSILLLSLALAGCAGAPAPPGSSDSGPVSAGSGRLEGSVVNDAFVGVPGASVRAVGTTESRKTDLEGRFVFASLPSGSYRLRVDAPGWVPAEVTVAIVESATTQVTIFADPLVSADPYSELYIERNKLNCVALRVITHSTEGMVCSVFRADLGFAEDWAGTVTEVTWAKGFTSTPYSRVSLLQKNASESPTYARQISESPAKVVLRPSTLHTQYQADAATPAKHTPAPLFAELAKSPVQLGAVDVRVGLTVDQEFVLYHTTFYVEAPPTLDDYTALPS